MPCNYKEDYPPGWRKLSRELRAAAGHRCQQCGAQHHQIGRRIGTQGTFVPLPAHEQQAIWEDAGFRGLPWPRRLRWLSLRELTRISVATAHLDHNRRNNDPTNLRVLCQRCHTGHDEDQQMYSRKYGSAVAETVGQLFALPTGDFASTQQVR